MSDSSTWEIFMNYESPMEKKGKTLMWESGGSGEGKKDKKKDAEDQERKKLKRERESH